MDSLTRILYIYAMLNQSVRQLFLLFFLWILFSYIQGMNEIVALLFWIYEPCEEYEIFWLFIKVMAVLKEGFLKSYDDYSTGIY